MNKTIYYLIPVILLCACTAQKKGFGPMKKFSPAEMQEDFRIFRTIVQEQHPGAYWYTSKEELDRYFEIGASQLNDSLSERNFRKVLSYVYAQVRCGHSSIRSSKQYDRNGDSLRYLGFPLRFKLWKGVTGDTAVVTGNLHRSDSIFKRGTIVKSIDGRSIAELTDTLSKFISSDGYSVTHPYQVLSNTGNFGTLYTTVFGIQKQYEIGYLDSLGQERSRTIPVYDPRQDSSFRRSIRQFVRISRKQRKKQLKQATRSLVFGDPDSTAFMTINTFANEIGFKSFIRSSFRKLKRQNTKTLVIDVRANGGGNVGNSTLITRLLADKPFRLADTLYSIRKRSPYGKYIKGFHLNKLFYLAFTRKREDGFYHFGYYERHAFKPIKRIHFDGQVFILTGGNSFSATTLFATSLREQSNITIVGEETGGGAYGNTAWLIPEATLPNTKVRFRIPLFRLVIHPLQPKDGRGVKPEIEALPTVEAIKNGRDYKMEKVLAILKESQ